MTHRTARPPGRMLARPSRLWLLAALLAGMAGPTLLQDGLGPASENAGDRRHGSGWDRDPGYRVADGGCTALDILSNTCPT